MEQDPSGTPQRAVAGPFNRSGGYDRHLLIELALDAVPALISYIDSEHRFRLTSKSCETWFGQPHERLEGQHVRNVIGVEAYEQMLPVVERALAGERVTYEGKVRDQNGIARAIRATFVPDRGGDGRVRGFCALVNDVTAQVAAREEREELLERERVARAGAEAAAQALRRQRHITQTIAANATACLFMLDERGRCTFMNPAAERITGFALADVVGRSLHQLTHHTRPDGRPYPQSECPIDRALLQNVPLRAHEDVFLRKDGSFFPVICAASPIYENGMPVGTVLEVRDLTEEKRAQDAMRESSERLRAALHASATGTYSWEVRSNRLVFDESLDRLFGTSPDDVRAIGDLVARVHLDDRGAVLAEISRCVEEGRDFDMEYRMVLPEGSVRWVLNKGKMFFDPDGKPAYMTGACKDVTDRKLMEDELMKMQKLESVGVLAGGIAHDFNNILTAILGNIALARLHATPGDRIDVALVEAERASARARDLTAQLLTFSRGGAPVKRTASITEVVRDTAAFVLSGSNVSCDCRIAPDLWPVDVDVGQISQVINNLVLNAREAMPHGGVITVTADNRLLIEHQVVPLPAGRYVRLVVSDSGVGIPAQHVRRIFDPYFTTKQAGSGLGLATTYAVIKKHDGHIEVESALGAGTRFTVYLPASQKPVPAAAPQTPARHAVAGGRVLLMDDEESIRRVGKALLSKLGFEVTVAREGGEAVALYEQALRAGARFDAVIVDLTVPGGMGGKDCIQRLRELDPQVRAIVSSGYSNDPVMAEYPAYGFAGVVAKPYELRQLGDALHAILTGAAPE